ncbi:PspC domain-containing protein [Sphingorhabdus sp. Alg239-R122]|uniref:PspC domain-containing protein n=1 Tax=Sphingorhabdus sp. Alg239-R122 TaxID=2305989 RepID=UPI0013D9DD0C|nr:PspC domain-containing protein [Sphingorhabdus sp. Alg239-R122]
MKNSFRLDKSNAKFMGVCAGIANWAEIDVTLVRILWALAVICGIGAPVLIYLLIGLIAN